MAGDPLLTLVSTTDPLPAVQAALGIKPEETPAEPAKAPEIPAAPAAAAPAAGTPTAPVGTPAQAAETKTTKKEKDGLQSRIDELVKQRDTARGLSNAQDVELQALRRRVEELVGAQGAAPAKTEPVKTEPVAKEKPKVEDFPDYDAYVEALIDWKAEQIADTRVKAAFDTEKNAEVTEEQRRRTQALLAAHNARVVEAKKVYDDFDEVISQPDMQISVAMRDGIMLSEHGAHIAYYLAKHPDERETMLKLGDTPQALIAFGRLATKVEAATATTPSTTAPAVPVAPTAQVTPTTAAPAAPAVTRAPDPIVPVGGTQVTTTVRPDQMSYADYKRYRDNQIKERQTVGAR